MVHILLEWDRHFTDLLKVHKRTKAEEVEVPGLEPGRTDTVLIARKLEPEDPIYPLRDNRHWSELHKYQGIYIRTEGKCKGQGPALPLCAV